MKKSYQDYQKRIAIITMYHKSTNYGGVLQAYALVKVLEELGYSAIQVSYKHNRYRKNKNLIYSIMRTLYHQLIKIRIAIWNMPIQKDLNSKIRKFSKFRDSILHTNPLADDELCILNDSFDVFIVGSDQVWHPNNFGTAYSLSFVDKNKKRIAYSASIAHPNIPPEKQESYKKELQKYYSISVREKLSVTLIEDLGFQATRTLDPTLLLDRSDWEDIASDSMFKSKYIFCYFFENDDQRKVLVERVSRITKLPIISLASLDNRYHRKNKWKKINQIIDAAPQDLLALIRDASYIFTDSYHVSVFSCLFEKDFFVFSRGEMGSRIETLLNDFDCLDRFIHDHEYDSFDLKIKRNLPSEISIQQLREDSFNFLKTSIED